MARCAAIRSYCDFLLLQVLVFHAETFFDKDQIILKLQHTHSLLRLKW